MQTFSMRSEIAGRIARLQTMLDTSGLDGALLVEKVDVFYFSGCDQDAHLWIPTSGKALLMVRKSIERARQDARLDAIVPLGSFSQLPDLIDGHQHSPPRRIGLELDVLPARLYLTYIKHFPQCTFEDATSLVRRVRMIKSPYEIDCITRAAAMADNLLAQVPLIIRNAPTESALALELEACYRRMGHPGILRTRAFNSECFYGHVLAGKSSTAPSNAPGPTGGEGPGPFYSQGAGHGPIRPHEPVIVDYTANVNGYVADQARIFAIGSLSEKFQRAHRVMCDIQNAVARRALPGTPASDLYDLALQMADEAGLSKGFMGYPEAVPFVAHGVGLELDEWPVIGRGIPMTLKEGMVIAMEPKYIFPGEGVVGIENTFLATPDGLQKLNHFPDEICIV